MTMCVRGGLLATDKPDPDLQKWLASKIDDALSDESDPTVKPAARVAAPATDEVDDEDGDEAPTDPGPPQRTATPVAAPLTPGAWTVPEEDEDEDPETVQAALPVSMWSEPDEDAADPETVQRSRLPLSFIGESVMDDNTVLDGSDASKSWREETAGLRREVMAERARAEARQPDPEATAPRARPAPPPLTDDPTADLPAAGSAAPPAEDVDGGWARWLAVTVFVAFLACVVGLVYVYR